MGARTSNTWKERNNGHVVRGRIVWHSPPLKVKLTKRQPSRAPPAADGVDGEKRESFGGGYWNRSVPPFRGEVPKSQETKDNTQDSVQPGEGVLPQATVMAGLVASFALLIFIMARRGGLNGSHWAQVRYCAGAERGVGGWVGGWPQCVRLQGRISEDLFTVLPAFIFALFLLTSFSSFSRSRRQSSGGFYQRMTVTAGSYLPKFRHCLKNLSNAITIYQEI